MDTPVSSAQNQSVIHPPLFLLLEPFHLSSLSFSFPPPSLLSLSQYYSYIIGLTVASVSAPRESLFVSLVFYFPIWDCSSISSSTSFGHVRLEGLAPLSLCTDCQPYHSIIPELRKKKKEIILPPIWTNYNQEKIKRKRGKGGDTIKTGSGLIHDIHSSS